MAPRIARLSVAFGACVVATFGLLTLATLGVAEARQAGMGQSMGQGMGQGQGMGMGQGQGMGMAGQKAASVTGCVQKGVEAGGYYLTAADGKVWELTGKAVKLDKLVGDTATVLGREVRLSKTAEAKLESNEMKEAAGKAYGDFQVSSVKDVSHGCGG